MSTPAFILRRGPLSVGEMATLRTVAGAMIPASDEFAVPGADDERILADIVSSLGRDEAAVREALASLDALAGGSLASAPRAARDATIERFRAELPALVPPLVVAVVRCYYRDDRVMRQLGMEVRPPYPKGFSVERGDWSLLDPVRERGPVWRRDA